MVGPRPTAATVAAAMPVVPALMTVIATGKLPPMAMLWDVANKLPAATFPIPACIPAAALPDRVFQSVYVEGSVSTQPVVSKSGHFRLNLPAIGPVELKPNMPRTAGATIGVKMAVTAATPTPTSTGSTTKYTRGFSKIHFEYALDREAHILVVGLS